MRGPHVRFCERRDGAIHRAYSTAIHRAYSTAGCRAPQAAGTLFKPRIGHGLQLFQAVKGLLARINRLTKVAHMSLDFTLSLRMPRLAGVDMEVQLRCKAPIRLVDDAPGAGPLGDRRLHVVDAQNRD